MRRFLELQGELGFTYEGVGLTATTPPAGYMLDHTRTVIGRGEQQFENARTALERWRQLRLGWVEAWPPDAPIRKDQVVAILARLQGTWWASACRIIYVIDDQGPGHRFGFAYGTLPDHAGTGEERFLLEWDAATDEVTYDILAFSRPHWRIARLWYPFMRRMQKRFARDSTAAMTRLAKSEPANDAPRTRLPEH